MVLVPYKFLFFNEPESLQVGSQTTHALLCILIPRVISFRSRLEGQGQTLFSLFGSGSGVIIKSKEAAKNHEAAMKLHIDRPDTRAPPPRRTLVRAATAASKKPLLGNYSEAASRKFLFLFCGKINKNFNRAT